MFTVRIEIPTKAKIGAALCTLGGVAIVIWTLWVWIVAVDVGFPLETADVFLLGLLVVFGFLLILSAILALLRRYLAGGVMALIIALNSLFFVYDVVELLIAVILSVIGGALILLAKERAQPSVLNLMRLYHRMRLEDLASKLSTDEATVELAVLELRSRGEPIEFLPDTREVVYGARMPEFQA